MPPKLQVRFEQFLTPDALARVADAAMLCDTLDWCAESLNKVLPEYGYHAIRSGSHVAIHSGYTTTRVALIVEI